MANPIRRILDATEIDDVENREIIEPETLPQFMDGDGEEYGTNHRKYLDEKLQKALKEGKVSTHKSVLAKNPEALEYYKKQIVPNLFLEMDTFSTKRITSYDRT